MHRCQDTCSASSLLLLLDTEIMSHEQLCDSKCAFCSACTCSFTAESVLRCIDFASLRRFGGFLFTLLLLALSPSAPFKEVQFDFEAA